MDDAVRGQDEGGGAVHVDEGHHDELVGSRILLIRGRGCGGRASAASTLVPIGKGGFVAMVSVGDDESFVAHGGVDRIDDFGIRNLPNAMQNLIFIGNGDVRLGRGGEERFDLSGVLVKHENLAEGGGGGAEKIESVSIGLGQGLLVPEDDAGGIVLNPAESYESAAFQWRG